MADRLSLSALSDSELEQRLIELLSLAAVGA